MAEVLDTEGRERVRWVRTLVGAQDGEIQGVPLEVAQKAAELLLEVARPWGDGVSDGERVDVVQVDCEDEDEIGYGLLLSVRRESDWRTVGRELLEQGQACIRLARQFHFTRKPHEPEQERAAS